MKEKQVKARTGAKETKRVNGPETARPCDRKAETARDYGRRAEALAAAYLRRSGVKILEQNFRSRFGEIDLIGLDVDDLVFIEVKARKTDACGYPGEALTIWKRKHICQTARFYCAKMNIPPNEPLRFDVVEIMGDKIRHTKNAFEYC